MVWARFDDNWTERDDILALTLPERWHLIGMIVYCCRNENWDGNLRLSDARRASDVDDPDTALRGLLTAGLLQPIPDGVHIIGIENHVPDEPTRQRKEKDRLRKQRQRAHAKDNHSYCTPENCDIVASQIQPLSLSASTPTSLSFGQAVEVPVPVPVPVPDRPQDSPRDRPQDTQEEDEYDKNGNEVPEHLRGRGAQFDPVENRWVSREGWLS